MPGWLVHNWAMPLGLSNVLLTVQRLRHLNGQPLSFELQRTLGGIGDSGFASFGQALLPWLAVNASEVTTRNLSLTLESTGDSTAKAIAAQ